MKVRTVISLFFLIFSTLILSYCHHLFLNIDLLQINEFSKTLTKAQVGQFLIENQELKTGDTIFIKGPTTGNEKMQVGTMLINGTENTVAKPGDKVTFVVPFKIRESDKIYKI